MPDPKIRVLVAKPGLDGHDRGAKVIARALRDAGMEVIYTGLRQTPEMIVNASLQEDVQVIGLSILSGAHNAIVPRVMDLLKQNKMDDILVLVGGIIPDQDIEGLKKIGVGGIFLAPHGTTSSNSSANTSERSADRNLKYEAGITAFSILHRRLLINSLPWDERIDPSLPVHFKNRHRLAFRSRGIPRIPNLIVIFTPVKVSMRQSRYGLRQGAIR
jgi:methylmalonyl-CoA mutase C-terminal domain/subunit